MPIPDYETLMLPLLEIAAGRTEHQLAVKVSEFVDALAVEFNLTPEEQAELVPSGRQKLFYNRVYWARFYLTHAALLERAGHGRYRITGRGRDVLAGNPDRIDEAYLRQFPEFQDFLRPARKERDQQPEHESTPESGGTDVPPEAISESDTPDDELEAAFQNIRSTVDTGATSADEAELTDEI